MKKILALMLSALLLTATFTGCASSEYDTRDDDDDDDDDKDKDDDDDKDKDDDDDKDKDDDDKNKDDDDKNKDDDDDKDKDDDDDKDKDNDDDDEPLSTSDYKEQVTDLTIDYLSAIEDAAECFNTVYLDGDDVFDQLKDIKGDMEDEVDNAEKCLKKVQKLNPPKKMEDFHEDLVSALEKSQNMIEKLAAICDAEDEDELEAAFEKGNNASLKADEAFEKLAEYDDIEWFTDEIEDEFGGGFF